MSDEAKTYTYKRFMRDGSVKEVTAVVRTRKGPREPYRQKAGAN